MSLPIVMRPSRRVENGNIVVGAQPEPPPRSKAKPIGRIGYFNLSNDESRKAYEDLINRDSQLRPLSTNWVGENFFVVARYTEEGKEEELVTEAQRTPATVSRLEINL